MVPGHAIADRYVRPAYKTTHEQVDTKYGEHLEYQATREQTLRQSQAVAANTRDQVTQLNQANEKRNERIVNVLVQVTGETLDTFPKSRQQHLPLTGRYLRPRASGSVHSPLSIQSGSDHTAHQRWFGPLPRGEREVSSFPWSSQPRLERWAKPELPGIRCTRFPGRSHPAHPGQA